MKTYGSLSEVGYEPDSNGIKCCGSCAFLNTSGNALSCQLVTNARVIPQGICRRYKMLGGLEGADDAE